MTSATPPDPNRPCVLGAFDIACVVIGGIIGVGIFFTPSKVAAAVDEPYQVVLAWAVGGVLAVLGALVFAALSIVHPGEGGMFRYILRGFGPRIAFVYGWCNWLVIQAGALGIVALILASYLEQLVWGQPTLSASGQLAIAVAACLLFTGVNVLGLRLGKGVQNALTMLKVLAVFALVVLAWWAAPERPPAPVVAAPRSTLTVLAAAILPVLFSFGGWQQGSFVAGVARRPLVDVPVGILVGVAVVVLAYLTINLSFLDLLGIEGARASAAIGADAAAAALAPHGLGEVAGRVFAAVVVLSAAGILNTICLASPHVLLTMAREGMLPAAVGRVHPRSGAPVLAVLGQGLWAVVLLLLVAVVAAASESAQGATDPLGFLLNGVVFVDWVFFFLCGLVLFVAGRPAQAAGRGAPVGSLACAVLFVLGALAVTVGAVASYPVPSLAGLAVAVAGWAAFPLAHRAPRR